MEPLRRDQPISAEFYRPPSIRAILGGILLLIAVLMSLCSLSDLVKLAGAPFLFIPDRLGVVQQVSKDEVRTVSLDTSPTLLEISPPGPYVVYAANDDLLTITNLLEDAQALPWLTVKSQATGESLAVSTVERGLRPYDTSIVRGRPIYTFDIGAPGWYELRHPNRHATISILPDYTTGKETLIVFLTLLQIIAIASIPGFIYFRGYRMRREMTEAYQEQARRRAEEMRL